MEAASFFPELNCTAMIPRGPLQDYWWVFKCGWFMVSRRACVCVRVIFPQLYLQTRTGLPGNDSINLDSELNC